MFISQDNPDIYANYRDVLRNGLQNVRIEIVGEPPFHALHWEALKDPQSPQPLSLQAIMVRQNIKPPKGWATMRPSTTINLLIVTARPRGTKDVGYRTISRPLVESLRQTNIPVQIDILRPGTYKELENRLRAVPTGHYHVIHFDVHGAVLSFEQMQQVQESELAIPLINAMGDRIFNRMTVSKHFSRWKAQRKTSQTCWKQRNSQLY